MKKSKSRNRDTGDFTINNYANASKPVTRAKKSTLVTEAVTPELSWDEVPDDDFDVVVTEDGTKNIVYKPKNAQLNEQDRPNPSVYPEIVWYQISKYIKPEDVGRFARINKCTYAITKRESFWRNLYATYCANNRKLPKRLMLETSYQQYGLRQRVIRALYHTYDFFIRSANQESSESKHQQLVGRRCVNMWYTKEQTQWCIYLKFKRTAVNLNTKQLDFVNELSRIDANPEEDSQVLQVTTCQKFCEKPEIFGLTLCSATLGLARCLSYHKLVLEFTTGPYVSKNLLSEQRLIIDNVKNVHVYNWWHPKYPHFDNTLPSNLNDDEAQPMLKRDFFQSSDTKK